MVDSREAINKKQDPLRWQDRLRRQDKKYYGHSTRTLSSLP